MKTLYLSSTNRKIWGICGGVGEYFDTDPTVIRLIWIVVTIITGIIPGILAYIVSYFVIPKKPSQK